MGMVLGKQYIPLNCKGGATCPGVSMKLAVPYETMESLWFSYKVIFGIVHIFR